MRYYRIIQAFRASCYDELNALKPGNVHCFAGGHGMEVIHFEDAADAAAPHIATEHARVGARIEAAVKASVAKTGLNINLGIILLCAPLAAAYETGGPLREALAATLAALDIEDAAATFRAITLANPGGLGQAEQHDVHAPPAVGLREAMGAAASRDRIARQYVSDFADVFEIGVARVNVLRQAAAPVKAEAVHLAFMAAFPDSHIARKFGPEVAAGVRAEAEAIERAVDWKAPDARRRIPLAEFDASLKERGLNPGTSADLTVASLFAARLLALTA